ncbi:hypothetical protein Q31b_58850 [Novipirellula aureliae]|uniref:Uncharacterized protein n=1 Tax=Novipirellula aureliae TaxID=2527966 RepID=A0A5C6D660_9BACT|nr:hypothetical protein Q31b_58850 [Novipirellula aureliae]
MHVFIQGIHIFTLIDPVVRDGKVVGNYKVVHKNRFSQKIGFLRRGQTVSVLVGGLKGRLETEPSANEVTIHLLDGK